MNRAEQLRVTTTYQEAFSAWFGRFYREWQRQRETSLADPGDPHAFVAQLREYYQQELEPEQAFLEWRQSMMEWEG